MKENRFYTYIYLDPRKKGGFTYGKYVFKYEPFYVGKGSTNRLTRHLYETKHSEKVNKIKKIKREIGTDPIIFKVTDNLLERDALDLEIKLIATIGRNKNWLIHEGPLVNQTNGGETSSGYEHTEETKNKIKNSKLGQTHNNTTRLKISKALKGKYVGENNKHTGKILSKATRKKISEKLKGIELDEDRKKNISIATKLAMPNRTEFEIYKNNKLIARYLSAKDLKHSEHRMNRKLVHKCIEEGSIEHNGLIYKKGTISLDSHSTDSDGVYTV